MKEVPFGTYRIVEVSAPSGYITAAETTVEHNEEKTAVTVADERAKANALLVKRDATTAEPVSGATFELSKYSGGFWLAVEGGTYTDRRGRADPHRGSGLGAATASPRPSARATSSCRVP